LHPVQARLFSGDLGDRGRETPNGAGTDRERPSQQGMVVIHVMTCKRRLRSEALEGAVEK